MKKIYLFAPVLAAVALMVACNSGAKAASGDGAPASPEQSGSASANSVRYTNGSIPTTTTTATIADPTLDNMPAATLTIPSGWKMQGMMLTSPCTTIPAVVFRTYSPDGLMQMRSEPAGGWRWGGRMNMGKLPGCLPLNKEVSAAEFLNYYIGTIPGGVHLVAPIVLPEDQRQAIAERAVKINQLNEQHADVMGGITDSEDLAAIRIETVNGSFVIEERLRAHLSCQRNTGPNNFTGSSCQAQVDRLMAPKGQLDALMRAVDSKQLPQAKASDQWFQAKIQQQNEQASAFRAKMNALYQAENKMFAERAQQFSQTMMRNHEAYMQQQESEYQSQRANAAATMNARSTVASDYVDYALDQQTVAVGGGTAKVSSSYSQTWYNGSQWYQTNDPNSNPNGVLQGNWTLATPVHGNGQPR
ncbi:hypothetical protein DYQ86_15635 [Acidobacteria bacterium AB60]|nr:hypothetical protein DYQ86_15635 [Acidobacteria bacterium AB60]